MLLLLYSRTALFNNKKKKTFHVETVVLIFIQSNVYDKTMKIFHKNKSFFSIVLGIHLESNSETHAKILMFTKSWCKGLD